MPVRGIMGKDRHMRKVLKSNKMENICYEIRGPLLKEAKRLEGH